MKITTERIAIFVLAIVTTIFIMRDCARPDEEKESTEQKEYNSAMAELKGLLDSTQAIQEHAIKSLAEHKGKDSVAKAAFKIENTRLKKQLAIRRPQVQVMIDSTPPLKAFIQTQDSIILTQDVRIDSLEASMDFQRKLNEDLIITEFQEDKIEAAMQIQAAQRIDQLEKLSRKKERKSRFVKVLVPVVAVAGLLLGSQL